jgi:catechol 2,3-dioxygenase-like lactoylglutathione lyase family enzyme
MSLRALPFAILGLVMLPTPASAQTGFLDIVDHIHIAAPDQAAAVDWYRRHFGGEPMTEGPDRLMFGDTRFLVQRSETAEPSAGSAFDHIGFSVSNLDATLAAIAADGATVEGEARDVAGLFRLAFATDPWGIRLEIVQDEEKLGLHHLHLRSTDPAATLAWYHESFGGTVGQMKGRLDGVNFGGVWVLVQRGEATPTQGRAIDHIGFRPLDVDVSVERLRGRNVTITTEPRPLTLASGVSMRLSFIESPEGGRIELVQR